MRQGGVDPPLSACSSPKYGGYNADRSGRSQLCSCQLASAVELRPFVTGEWLCSRAFSDDVPAKEQIVAPHLRHTRRNPFSQRANVHV